MSDNFQKILGVTVYAYGYDGKRYRKKVMARPNGTLPFSEFFNPDDPLSDGWQEWGDWDGGHEHRTYGHNKTEPHLTWTTEKDEEGFDD